MQSKEPIHDIAHLAHVELLTPKLEESTRFFVEVMGMVESDRKDDSVYLRGWDDYEHHSLQLTAASLTRHWSLCLARFQSSGASAASGCAGEIWTWAGLER